MGWISGYVSEHYYLEWNSEGKKDEIQFWKDKDPIINSKNKLSKSELAEYENYCIELDRNILEAFDI